MPKVSKVIRMRKDAKEQLKKDKRDAAVKKIKNIAGKAKESNSDQSVEKE